MIEWLKSLFGEEKRVCTGCGKRFSWQEESCDSADCDLCAECWVELMELCERGD